MEMDINKKLVAFRSPVIIFGISLFSIPLSIGFLSIFLSNFLDSEFLNSNVTIIFLLSILFLPAVLLTRKPLLVIDEKGILYSKRLISWSSIEGIYLLEKNLTPNHILKIKPYFSYSGPSWTKKDAKNFSSYYMTTQNITENDNISKEGKCLVVLKSKEEISVSLWMTHINSLEVVSFCKKLEPFIKYEKVSRFSLYDFIIDSKYILKTISVISVIIIFYIVLNL
jgi:hypothetical protein